jgi:hypothetical protein
MTTLRVNIDDKFLILANKVIENIAKHRDELLEEAIANVPPRVERSFFFKKTYINRTRQEAIAYLMTGEFFGDIELKEYSKYNSIFTTAAKWEEIARTIIVAYNNGVTVMDIKVKDYAILREWAE